MDFNINDNKTILTSEIDLILQQIDILFDTNRREVLGDVEFGTEYDRYLYDLKVSDEAIRRRVYSDISSLNLYGFIPNVTVYMLQGTEKDIALIDIELSKDSNTYRKTYKIS